MAADAARDSINIGDDGGSRRRELTGGSGPAAAGFAVVILAAGATAPDGSRISRLRYMGRSLVEHSVLTALGSGAREVVVVAGEDHELLRQRLRRFPVRVVRTADPAHGIAGSIRAGVGQLRSRPGAAIIALGDQPKVTAEHLRALGERALAEGGPSAVASAYDGVIGAPCAFARRTFARLMALSGPEGARALLRDGGSDVETIAFAEANFEVGRSLDFLPLRNFYRGARTTSRYTTPLEARGPPSACGSTFAG